MSNENLNLVEILKDCPKGTKLYSPVFGDVEFVRISQRAEYPIEIKLSDNSTKNLTKCGIVFAPFRDVECMLFPSKDNRDWSKFKPKKPKFDPQTLKPFDKVLVMYDEEDYWTCNLFSNIQEKYSYLCVGGTFRYCIPYNDDTKHLLETEEEAPEFYRYWEE